MPPLAPPLLDDAYPPISGYGAIGDGRSVALVSPQGSVDWWCPGRFDGPSLFARILDAHRGGSFSLAPATQAQSRMAYVPDTNVLETEHVTPGGRVKVVDLCLGPEDTGVDEAVLLRRVVGLEGEVEMRARLAPRFQYGRVQPRFFDAPAGAQRRGRGRDADGASSAAGLLVRGGGEILHLRGPRLGLRRPGSRERRFVVRAGEAASFVLRHRAFDTPVPFAQALAFDDATLVERAIVRWRTWAQRTRFEGPDAALVRRSALALKLLQHESGALVAAATTSLPEEVGGVRNWDYRYAWVRDGALMAGALRAVGHHAEAEGFAGWLHRTLGERPEALSIMYSVGGSQDLAERELPHLDGHRGSKPVRVGNGAAHQRQLDVYGELLDFLHAQRATDADASSWPFFHRIAEWIVAHWREPDQGIWEMRCEPRHFVLSKAMAWVALDRAAKVARDLGRHAEAARWRHEANAIRADVLEKGYDAERGAFVQAYGMKQLDASNLLLPLVGFLDARDPRMVSTVERTLDELVTEGLVYRYVDGGDGVPGGEATFAYCTFWLVEVLAKQGRVHDARALFDRLVGRAGPPGLFAEEIDAKTGEHLGNYPQGFPHAGLIQAAVALREAERGDGARGAMVEGRRAMVKPPDSSASAP